MLSGSGLGLLAAFFILPTIVSFLTLFAFRTSALITTAFFPAFGLSMALLVAIEVLNITLLAFLALSCLSGQCLIRRSAALHQSSIVLVSGESYDDGWSHIGAGNCGCSGYGSKSLRITCLNPVLKHLHV